MSELRKNIITDDWVIFAKDRSQRPTDFLYVNQAEHSKADNIANCPFCPGNEKQTTKEIFRAEDKDGNWLVRVIPNKYPALDAANKMKIEPNDIFYKLSGFGYHEVVIETPNHNCKPSEYSQNEIASIIQVYKNRFLELQKKENIKTVIIFKNHGKNAGTSLKHPHSQIVALPFVPKMISQRISIAAEFLKTHSQCIFCSNYLNELKEGVRIIQDTRHFTAFIPFAALSPYHLWIFPKKHSPSFESINTEEIKDLSAILSNIFKKIDKGLHNPDFNMMIRSLVQKDNPSPYFHWYISVIPRINKAAGFELSTGTFINPSHPEDSAAFLNSIK